MKKCPLQIATQMTIDQWLIPPLSDSITPSILARAGLLVTKTAFLAGMAAPETAACLSKLLMVSEAQYSIIIEGHHTEPGVQKDALKSADKYSTLRKTPELRRCGVSSSLLRTTNATTSRWKWRCGEDEPSPALFGSARATSSALVAFSRLGPNTWRISRSHEHD